MKTTASKGPQRPDRPTPTDSFEVELDQDHPGLSDLVYRRRRDEIARQARAHVPGTPVAHVAYTEEEEATWRAVWRHLRPELEATALSAVLESMQAWAPWERGIPQLDELSAGPEGQGGSRVVHSPGPLFGTGIRFEPVDGLLSSRDFFASLKEGIFRSTQYLRHGSRPHYTPEPDLVHEIVGHASTFSIDGVAELSCAFGDAAATADDEALLRLERLYWFTLEFGLVEEGGEPKAFGAGLLSSAGELAGVAEADLRPFSCEAVEAQAYDTDHMQPVFFVAQSLDELIGQTLERVKR